MMPGLDGFALLRAIRSDAELRSTPVVLLSARAGEEATAEGLGAGADDYLTKPFTARELLVRVAARLATAKGRAEAEALARELHVATQRLLAAQAVAGIGIFDWSVGDTKAYWSEELYALLGLAPNAIEATPAQWNARISEEDRERAADAFRAAAASRAPRMELELRLRQPDATTRWVRMSTQILYADDGTPARVIGAVIDVQVLKEAAAARERMLAEAERTNRAKDEFLATMSHELRTPLNAMLGWSRMLKVGTVGGEKLAKGLDVIERNARTQARLVSDLLDVSRIISGKLRLAMRRIDLASIVLAAVDVVKPAADAKRVRLVARIAPEVGPMLADPDRVQQIVWNLLTNAVRFTPAEGVVSIDVERADSLARIVVADTGAGIAQEHLTSIFDRFRQVDGSTTRAHGGLGLGLSIVRYLVEAHGGSVSAESEGLGKGARFVVTFPVRAVAAPADYVDPTATPVPERSWTNTDPPLRGVRALVVDDDRDSLELLRLVLEGAGAVFTGVTSAQQALDAPGPYDVIISDIGMPQMDGYALMRRIRARDEAGDVPAIALTAYARAEDAERAIRAGYQAHLAKPVDEHELLETVARWTSVARMG